jgi:AcrR family transcriptional regulator
VIVAVDDNEPGDSAGRRQRVPALSAEERRAALIEATIPLLRECGASVSTRQIADAAGVAEGTIFGVFKDKASLLRAAVAAALDPTPLLESLAAIDRALSLRERLVRATRLMRERTTDQGAVFFLVRGPLYANDRQGLVDLMATRFIIINALTNLIEPDAAQLRRSPAIAARLLVSMVGSPRGAFGWLDEQLDDEDVVSIVLDGLLVRPQGIETFNRNPVAEA